MRKPGGDFWLGHIKHIEYITSIAVGFKVEVYHGGPEVSGVRRGLRWQVMPSREAEEKVSSFWAWHIVNNCQWFTTPLEAAACFIEAHRKWLNRNSGSHKSIQSS